MYATTRAALSLVVPSNSDQVLNRLEGMQTMMVWNCEQFSGGNPIVGLRRKSMELMPEEGGRGPGGSCKHPMGAAHFSKFANQALFKYGSDETAIQYFVDAGFVGKWGYINSCDDIPELCACAKIYGTDGYGPSNDPYMVNAHETFSAINDKSRLGEFVAEENMPVQAIVDLEALPNLYSTIEQLKGNGLVVFKSANGEHGGTGVKLFRGDFHEQVTSVTQEFELRRALHERYAQYRDIDNKMLNTRYIVQRGFHGGTDHSFQLFLDPTTREVLLLAVSEQFTTSKGVNSGNANLPISQKWQKILEQPILTMAEKIWAQFPDAFGFFMADFYLESNGRVVIYDVGLRPSANTPAALTRIRAEERTGRTPFVHSDVRFETRVPNLKFAEIAHQLGSMIDIESTLNKEGGILYGWNVVQGDGRFVMVAEVPEGSQFAALGMQQVQFLANKMLERLRQKWPSSKLATQF